MVPKAVASLVLSNASQFLLQNISNEQRKINRENNLRQGGKGQLPLYPLSGAVEQVWRAEDIAFLQPSSLLAAPHRCLQPGKHIHQTNFIYLFIMLLFC